MDVYQWFMIGLGVLGFVVHGAVVLVWATWQISRVEIAIREMLEAYRREVDDDLNTSIRHSGEGLAALRQRLTEVETGFFKRITEVEIWSRDNLVRRDSFFQVTGELKETVSALGQKIDAKFEKLSLMIDKKIDNARD